MSDFEPFSYVNGEAATALSIQDRGLAYGDGLFETMRLEAGRIPLWSFHSERLFQSCARLRITLHHDQLQDDLSRVLAHAAASSVNEGVVKLIITRGAGGRGYHIASDLRANRVLMLSPLPRFPSHFWTQGVRVYLCQHRLPDNPLLAGIKHLNKLDYVMACQEWSSGDFQEGLLLSNDGHVVEACARNVFIVRNGTLFTPHLAKAGVAGILRRRIMENYAAEIGVSVEEAAINLEFLATADEVFLTNSITGVWPVKEVVGENLDKLQFSNREIGNRLQQLFIDDLGLSSGGHDA